MREKLCEFLLGVVVSDCGECVFEPLEGIDVGDFAAAQQGLYDRVVNRPFVGLAEEVVLAPHHGGSLPAFHGIVVEHVPSVVGIPPHARPQLVGIPQGFAKRVVGRA